MLLPQDQRKINLISKQKQTKFILLSVNDKYDQNKNTLANCNQPIALDTKIKHKEEKGTPKPISLASEV